MTEHELLELAGAEGFLAAMLPPEQIPVDPSFRAYCEQNLCGHYGANYSCPPDCGSPEALHRSILQERQILIVETIWKIKGYADKAGVRHARVTHNAAVLRLMERLTAAGYAGFCAGYNGCPLCAPLQARGESSLRPSGAANQLPVRLLRGCRPAGKALPAGIRLAARQIIPVWHDCVP